MAEPVTLALAKAHCRIDPSDTDHDEVLATYIQAAREWVEDFTGLVLVSRPFTKAVEAFGSYVQLDRRPVTAVESIAYLDTDGAEQPFTDFTINLATGRVYASQWPAIGRNGYATVTYTAGYAPEEVPVALVQAMLLLIGHSFRSEEHTSELQSLMRISYAVFCLKKKKKQ